MLFQAEILGIVISSFAPLSTIYVRINTELYQLLKSVRSLPKSQRLSSVYSDPGFHFLLLHQLLWNLGCTP